MFNPNTGKLTVEFKEGVTEKIPIIPRRYTLTHPEHSGDLFLTIGPDFVYDKINLVRDDVLGEWIITKNGIQFIVYLHPEEYSEQGMEDSNHNLLRGNLPLALSAIRQGDRQFFGRMEMNHYPIIIYFLYKNPEYNRAENWGTFSDYKISTPKVHATAEPTMEYHVLMDEKMGDVNGDGIPDKVSVYGDKSSDSDFLHNIILEVKFGGSDLGADVITELNGYNPVLFLGDFTKDGVNDILFQMDKMFNSMNSRDKGEYGISIDMIIDNHFETIFASDNYNTEYRFLVEFNDYYKISILSVMKNKLFFLDISYKDLSFLSQYYYENGELIKPVQGEVLHAEAFLPVVSSKKDNYYDLLAVHRVVESNSGDTLGYIENLLSWDGKFFVPVNMQASTQGRDLVTMN